MSQKQLLIFAGFAITFNLVLFAANVLGGYTALAMVNAASAALGGVAFYSVLQRIE
jgi:hypothetical protein